MNIKIICGYPIPKGMAATTRIFSYAKGLVECGDNVEVISYIVSSSKLFSQDYPERGIFNRVNYSYSYKRNGSKILFARLFQYILSLFYLFSYVLNNNKKKHIDAILVSTDNLIILLLVSLLSLFVTTRFYFIFDEFPIPIRGKNKQKISLCKRLMYALCLHKFSGYISMTDTLLNFYQSICFHNGIIVSNITDISRFIEFEKTDCSAIDVWKVVYMGNLELSKDNVDNIVKAVNIVSKKYKIHLYLYGTPSIRDKEYLDSLINELGLFDMVSFGFVSYERVPSVLLDADILVSSQPDSVRASGGFPTKLGEYCITGIPVLLTDVGEIKNYFKPDFHVFYAKPNDFINYAEKLIYIINNYDKALIVGANAKKLITDSFSHLEAGKRIHDFIKE